MSASASAFVSDAQRDQVAMILRRAADRSDGRDVGIGAAFEEVTGMRAESAMGDQKSLWSLAVDARLAAVGMDVDIGYGDSCLLAAAAVAEGRWP